jgi:maltooligosyltrehalose synthase
MRFCSSQIDASIKNKCLEPLKFKKESKKEAEVKKLKIKIDQLLEALSELNQDKQKLQEQNKLQTIQLMDSLACIERYRILFTSSYPEIKKREVLVSQQTMQIKSLKFISQLLEIEKINLIDPIKIETRKKSHRKTL